MTSPSAAGSLGLIRIDDRSDTEVAEDGIRHRRRGARERIGAARNLRKRDDLADVGLTGHEREEALDAHREASVRRRAHAERVEQEAELLALLLLAETHRPEDSLLHLRPMHADRAGAELPAVPDQFVVLAEHPAWIALEPVLVAFDRCGERMVDERPAAARLVRLEEREVDGPEKLVALRVGEPELAAEVGPQTAEDAGHDVLRVGDEEDGCPRVRAERLELLLREELRDRRADLAAVVHEVGEPLRA